MNFKMGMGGPWMKGHDEVLSPPGQQWVTLAERAPLHPSFKCVQTSHQVYMEKQAYTWIPN